MWLNKQFFNLVEISETISASAVSLSWLLNVDGYVFDQNEQHAFILWSEIEVLNKIQSHINSYVTVIPWLMSLLCFVQLVSH